MSRSIFITGVPGSGKTSVHRELRRRGRRTYEIEYVEGLYAMVDKSTGKVTKEIFDMNDFGKVTQHDWVCNRERLQQFVRRNTEGVTFYCGTAANADELVKVFDATVLLKASPQALLERLGRRGRSDFGFNPELRKWVLSWKEGWERGVLQEGAMEVDADRSVTEVVNDLLKVAQGAGTA